MKLILILFMAVAFISCSSSGKLSHAKFPHIPSLPINVGSYTLAVIPHMPCIDCEVAEMHLKVVEIFAAFLFIFGVIAFIINRKDKEIFS